ncbi:hypothetical protein GWI33_009176 [Rhynchophorus ferrugineus]|uniref:Uncharacterized protein n=1 Tax=Rhynchophorus ferrugineus TaxID=354439 RepID=A0A834MGP0_RHYFE|nr:hypothetical protein GWI33_009176 [Rhynchophorus ferrugineus]
MSTEDGERNGRPKERLLQYKRSKVAETVDIDTVDRACRYSKLGKNFWAYGHQRRSEVAERLASCELLELRI